MRLFKGARTSLVISMTLAELFLLMLFVVWYGVAADHDPTPAEVLVAQLQSENRRLTEELKTTKTILTDVELRLKWYRDQFMHLVALELTPQGRGPGTGKTGLPRCQPSNNRLADVSLVNGEATLTVKITAPGLASALGDWGEANIQHGMVLKDPEIEQLLTGVSKYRLVEGEELVQCRFTYWFSYGTFEDYYRGRERFEKYFYLAGRNQLAALP